MEKNYLEQQLIKILCKEFQSVWLIKLADLSLEIFTSDEKKIIANSVNTASIIKSYEDARLWYIENCVMHQSKDKMLEQTQLEYVLSKLGDGEPFVIEYSRVNDGKMNFNQVYYDIITNPENELVEYVVMGFRDIDKIKKADIDELTGVLTRQAFFNRAEKLLKDYPDTEYDVVISDIIDFKKVNEIYGAKVADDILRWRGKFLFPYISQEVIIGRYGGDQFVMLGEHDAIKHLVSRESKDKFLKAEKDSNLPIVKSKLGIYLNVSHDKSIISICDKALMALNSIKHQYNKDYAFYNDEIKNMLEKQRRIEESMYDSLENGDFKVFYQPKHSAKTGELVGAEALVRWIHPEYGFMSPADFIPLFEQNGFIVESDRYVWKRTCENLRRWKDEGFDTVPISVNASKLTMINELLVSDMEEGILKNSLQPSQLHIEITETLMTENVNELIKKLNKIREIGFKVELDDFGAGYSSINILSTLPLDIIKFDMSFMQQFGEKKRTLVLESCIELAKRLGFETVSEGVEQEEQIELLGELGVDMIQGYYYSKPLCEEEFEKYMMEHTKKAV